MTDEEAFRETALMRLTSIDDGMAEINRHLRTLNGRVGKLEERNVERDIKEAREDGFDDGKALAVLTRAQLAIALSVMSAMSALAGLVARYWPT